MEKANLYIIPRPAGCAPPACPTLHNPLPTHSHFFTAPQHQHHLQHQQPEPIFSKSNDTITNTNTNTMMFSMRSPLVRLAMLAVAMLCVIAAGEAQANVDHVDARKLQEEMTMAPTAAPSSAPTAVPTPSMDGSRGLGDDDFTLTGAPTAMPLDVDETSGASSWRSTASVASALAFVGTVAVAAVVA